MSNLLRPSPISIGVSMLDLPVSIRMHERDTLDTYYYREGDLPPLFDDMRGSAQFTDLDKAGSVIATLLTDPRWVAVEAFRS